MFRPQLSPYLEYIGNIKLLKEADVVFYLLLVDHRAEKEQGPGECTGTGFPAATPVRLGMQKAAILAEPSASCVVLPQRLEVHLVLDELFQLVFVSGVTGATVVFWGSVQVVEFVGTFSPKVRAGNNLWRTSIIKSIFLKLLALCSNKSPISRFKVAG